MKDNHVNVIFDPLKTFMRPKINGVEVSPCILAKAKFALGIPNRYVFNDKKCSKDYWNKVVIHLGSIHGKTKIQIENAKRKFELFL